MCLIEGIDLKNVTQIRLQASSRSNWIGVLELEAHGWAEGS